MEDCVQRVKEWAKMELQGIEKRIAIYEEYVESTDYNYLSGKQDALLELLEMVNKVD